MKTLIITLALMVPASALAQRAPTTSTVPFTNSSSQNRKNVLEGVALNATEATRTIELRTWRSYSKLVIAIFHTNSAATDVQTTFECALACTRNNAGTGSCTDYARLQSRAVSAGTSTLSDFTDVKPVSGNTDWYQEYDVRSCDGVRIVFSGTSAGGSDTVDVQATAVVGD